MTGFINRLFRRKPLPGESSTPQSQQQPQPQAQQQKGGAYFLDPDDAKTYGDIDYMRTARKVRKTFMGGSVEMIEEISATEKRRLNDQAPSKSNSETSASTPASTSESAAPTPQVERRRASSEMDMFRNMAKDLGKKS